jgi:hypothetical protein
MSASQRRKGAAFERLAAQWFREAMPGAEVFRGSQAWEKSTDPDLRMPYFAPECKVGQRPNIYRAMDQAVTNAGDRMPVVVSRKNGHGPRPAVDLITFRADDALLLLRQWWDAFGREEWVE